MSVARQFVSSTETIVARNAPSVRRMKRQAVEINTKRNNWHLGRTVGAADATGGVSMEIYQQIYKQLLTAEGQAVSKALDPMEFRQSLDLAQTYVNRSQPIISTWLTAAILNSGNRFLLSVAAPLWETDEMNFHTSRKEWNCIEYDDVAEGGIAGETSFSKWGWTDKLKQKKQSATVTMDLALDETYGKAEWDENLAQLASDALLTLYKEVAYAIMTIGYTNMVEDRAKNIPFDLSRLYQAETAAMMVFAMDQNRGFDMIRALEERIPGLNLVILPRGASRFIREVHGESRRMEGTLITTNQQTNAIEARIVDGPDSFKSVKLGNGTLDFQEMPGFRTNSRDPSTEDPLVAKITLAQFFPPNHQDCDDDEVVTCDATALQMRVFYQTKEVGNYHWIQFAEMLRHCWQWDRESGAPSVYLRQAAQDMNRLGVKPAVEHSYGRPGTSVHKFENLRDMDTFRDVPTGVTFDAEAMVGTVKRGLWRVANHMGGYGTDALPNAALNKVGRCVAKRFERDFGINLAQLFYETRSLLDDINTAEYTEAYITAFFAANTYGAGAVASDGVTQFPVNDVGSMRLPVGAGLEESLYPAGFASGPGLVTLAREANKPGSAWRVAGTRSAALVQAFEKLGRFLEHHVPGSEAVNPKNAGPWHGAQGSRAAVMIDTLVGRGAPVFVDSSVTGGTDPLAALVTELRGDTFASLAAGTGFDSGTGGITNEGLRALCSLNADVFDRRKGAFLDALATNDEATQLLVQRILALVPFGAPPAQNAVGMASLLADSFFEQAADARSDFIRRMADTGALKALVPKGGVGKQDANLQKQLAAAERKPGTAGATFRRTSLVASAGLRARPNRLFVAGDGTTLFRAPVASGGSTSGSSSTGGGGGTLSPLMRLAGAHRVASKTAAALDTGATVPRTPKSTHSSLGELFMGARASPDVFDREESMDVEFASGAATVVGDSYFGPWGDRLAYCDRLRSDVEQFFFLVMAQAPNTLPVQEGVAECGGKFVNVLLFRPFIEFTAKSIVCMQSGEGTLMTVMSRFKVLVSKEDRGIFHITANFYCGTVRTNPDNLALLPYCIPDRFLGGKNVDFMSHPSQWSLPNPSKPSFVAVCTSVAEGTNGAQYAGRVHMTNQPTYRRPGYDNDIYPGKHSAARLYETVFGKQTGYVDGLHRSERSQYWGSVDVSHVAHLAPRSFIDQRTGKQIDYEGVGPGNDHRMNTPGAEKTWNGETHYFPQLAAEINAHMRS